MKVPKLLVAWSLVLFGQSCAFTVSNRHNGMSSSAIISSSLSPAVRQPMMTSHHPQQKPNRIQTTSLQVSPNLEVIALVSGQETYGLAIVALGEALWSFLEAPSLSHAKVLIPATVAAAILVGVSGPMVTNASDAESIKLGLEISTGVSIGLGASYLARLFSPYSPSAKEIAFGGLLVAIAGFFSFTQNLLVDGFIQLPSLPSLPNIFPQNAFDE
mmetsp:Transcript_13284/g.24924  ORF Transcript_13284/g.24924 Transcript_13284/m.24924 type:complete len:215 (+) Transcript_13284:222-866(+)